VSLRAIARLYVGLCALAARRALAGLLGTTEVASENAARTRREGPKNTVLGTTDPRSLTRM
jgi:hypothetical protein